VKGREKNIDGLKIWGLKEWHRKFSPSFLFHIPRLRSQEPGNFKAPRRVNEHIKKITKV
jgi:hypothetical protein